MMSLFDLALSKTRKNLLTGKLSVSPFFGGGIGE
jgi:hypothetical protein